MMSTSHSLFSTPNAANQVQPNLLPRQPPSHSKLDIAGNSLHCDETSGAYYDYFGLPNIGLDVYGVAVGEVSGQPW